MAAHIKDTMNQKLSLNRAIISDILLWVVLALLTAYGVYLFAVVLPEKRGQIIHLQFRDANEISKGSSVRMMGMEIGFVNDVRIRHDHVEIVVQTNPNVPKIPVGSTFTILFTGLAGSKSIEVELPQTPYTPQKGRPVYFVENPIRMKDMLNSSIDVTQALQKGAENIADFFGKKKPVEELQFNIHQTHQMTVVAIQHFTGMQQAVDQVRQTITDTTLTALDTLSGLQEGASMLAHQSDPERLRPKVVRGLRTVRRFGDMLQGEASSAAGTITLQERLTQFNQVNAQIPGRIQQLKNQIVYSPFWQWVNAVEAQEDHADAFLDRANAFFSVDRLPALKQARQAIQAFNRQLMQWQARVNQTQAQPKSSQQNKRQPHQP